MQAMANKVGCKSSESGLVMFYVYSYQRTSKKCIRILYLSILSKYISSV